MGSPAIHVTAEVSQEASRSAVVGPQIPEGTQATSDDADSAVVVELEKKVAAAQEAADASSKNLEEVSVSLEKTNASLADANFSLLEMNAKLDKQTASLSEANQTIKTLEADKASLQTEVEKTKADMEDDLGPLRERAAAADKLEEELQASENRIETAMVDLRKEQLRAKKLHNVIEDLKGAVRVFARGRPMSKSEIERGNVDAVDYLDPTSVQINFLKGHVTGAKAEGAKKFVFDSVFSPSSTQEEVFEDAESLLDSVVDGFNVCIFAYGQTGSGKTFTMGGDKKNPGLTPRCVMGLAQRVAEAEEQGYRCSIKIYFVELYNEKLNDLLRKKTEKAKSLEVKMDARKQVYIRNAETVKISKGAKQIMDLFEEGNKARHVSSTKMNSQSSRSHSIFGIAIETTHMQSGKKTFGKLSLIDLAGSERAAKTKATKEQQREANSINKSLSALGDVISALTEGKEHIPYRNNKLTQLMQDSIGGSAKTLMFVNFSPADYNAEETIGSLTYAARVKKVTNNAEKATESREVANLKEQLLALQKQLLQGGGDEESSASSSSESEPETVAQPKASLLKKKNQRKALQKRRANSTTATAAAQASDDSDAG